MLLWFIRIDSICKQAAPPRPAGAVPWVQCYLLSQPRPSVPLAESCSHSARLSLLLTYVLTATLLWEQLGKVKHLQQDTAAFYCRLNFTVTSCCLTNDWKWQDIRSRSGIAMTSLSTVLGKLVTPINKSLLKQNSFFQFWNNRNVFKKSNRSFTICVCQTLNVSDQTDFLFMPTSSFWGDQLIGLSRRGPDGSKQSQTITLPPP